jgi:hypothetical protein
MLNFLLKFFDTKDLEKEIIKRKFIFPEIFSWEDAEDLWKKVKNDNPQIEKYINFRKNILLQSLFTSNKDYVEGAIGELTLIEKLLNQQTEYDVKEQKHDNNILFKLDDIFEKIKGRILNK